MSNTMTISELYSVLGGFLAKGWGDWKIMGINGEDPMTLDGITTREPYHEIVMDFSDIICEDDPPDLELLMEIDEADGEWFIGEKELEGKFHEQASLASLIDAGLVVAVGSGTVIGPRGTYYGVTDAGTNYINAQDEAQCFEPPEE